MPLISSKEALNLKLKTIPAKNLNVLAKQVGIMVKGKKADLIKSIINEGVEERFVNDFIKKEFLNVIQKRRELISDEELKNELRKVNYFSWGVVQGQLDQKIQVEYVRKYYRFNELVSNVKRKLHDDVTDYVICTWYNHWTTLLIEEHISYHPRVIPTLMDVKGVDIFFDGQPFDIKTTYLPKNYNIEDALKNPGDLITWMYENQGAPRFGADNRFYVIVFDRNNIDESWKLKRDFDYVFQEVDKFLDSEAVNGNNEIVFKFKKETFTAVSKILVIQK